MSDGGSYFIVIPAPVKRHPTLTAHAKLLFGEIAVKCNVRGYCWATNQYFADVFNCNIRSIQRYMKELEDASFVVIELQEDTEQGTKRKITVTASSQYTANIMTDEAATELSPAPVTELTPPPVTGLAEPHDIAVVSPRDRIVIQNNKSLDNNTDNNSSKTKEAPPPSGNAPGDLFGDTVPHVNGKAKKIKATPAAPSLHNRFIEIYSNWFKQLTGTRPKIDGKEAGTVKFLVSHFKKIVEDQAADKDEILDEQTKDDRAAAAWQFVFSSWNLLDNFTQSQTRLVDINSKLQNIIIQIKNSKRNGNGANQTGNFKNGSGRFADNSTPGDRLNSINSKYGDWDRGRA
jgi:hypothetical protein